MEKGSIKIFVKTFLPVVGLLLMITISLGQGNQKQKETKKLNTFTESKWKSLQKDLDYSEKKPLYEPKENDDFKFSSPFSVNSQLVQIVFFVIAAGVLVFVLIKLFQGPSNRKVNPVIHEYKVGSLNDNPKDSNLEEFLGKALHDKNYKLVIRLYYLMVIRELSAKKIILWKKDKTDIEYIREVSTQTDSGYFKELTYLFEWTWYSDNSLSENQFLTISEKFQQYIKGLKN